MDGVVRDVGENSHSCGYCGSENSFYSHGMVCSRMTVQAYQELLDIGWRRSGCYMYKPDLTRMCCPHYTIRLPVYEFVPSRTQRQTLKRLDKYLEGGALYPERKNPDNPPKSKQRHPVKTGCSLDKFCFFFKLLLEDLLQKFMSKEGLAKMDFDVVVYRPNSKQKMNVGSGKVFLSSPLCLTLYHKIASAQSNTKWNSPPEIALHFCELFKTESTQFLQQLKLSGLELETIISFLDQITLLESNGYLNFSQEQDSVHPESEMMTILKHCFSEINNPSLRDQDSTTELKNSTWNCTLPEEFIKATKTRRDFQMIVLPAEFIQEEYDLYKKYQISVHGDSESSCSQGQYSRFLIDTPLERIPPKTGKIPTPGFGSFHIQYRINNRLVGISVVDILPNSVSSKYFIWDPDFAPLCLGKVSALKEIQWIQDSSIPGFEYYYMGYYIHSCQKMRYKGEYCPSELLCPKKFVWVKLTNDIKQLLDRQKYTALSTGKTGFTSEDNWTDFDVDLCFLVSSERTVKFGDYVNRFRGLIERFKNQPELIHRIEVMIGALIKDQKNLLKILRHVAYKLQFQLPEYLPTYETLLM